MSTTLTIVLAALGVLTTLTLLGLFVRFHLLREKLQDGFVTKHGLHIIPSKKTSYLTSKLIEKWTDELALFWNQTKGWDLGRLYKTFDKTRVDMLDLEKLEYRFDGRTYFAVGLTQVDRKRVAIATLPKGSTTVDKERIVSLYKHELSHLPAANIGGLWTNDASHDFFSESGVGV